MKKIENILDKVTLAMAVLAMAAIIACIGLNFWEIVNRYFRGKSIFWIQDYTLLMMMWFIFPGITRVSFDKKDIIIDMLVAHLPKRAEAAVRTLTNALVAVLAALVSYESVRLMMLNWTKKMNVSRIPTRFYIVTMIFSFAIVAVIYLVRTIESLQEAAGKED